MKTRFLLLCLLPTLTFAEGELSVTPTHDILQGNGAIFELQGDVHLVKKYYVVQDYQLSTIERYRDANGKLDLEYRWTPIFATSVGAGYDSFHHYGDDRVESEDLHVKLKVKVW